MTSKHTWCVLDLAAVSTTPELGASEKKIPEALRGAREGFDTVKAPKYSTIEVSAWTAMK